MRPPQSESEFVRELIYGFKKAMPKNAYVQKTHSISGEPDLIMGFLVGGKYLSKRMRVECKYSVRPLKTLRQAWDMLRTIQQVTMINMAAAGEKVYLVVCVQGNEALWYRIDPDQARKVLDKKAPSFTVLALERKAKRWKEGKWTTGMDYGADQ